MYSGRMIFSTVVLSRTRRQASNGICALSNPSDGARNPIRSRAARTRLALVAGQLVTEYLKGNAEGGRWQLAMLNAVGDDLDSQLFGVANGFFPSCAVTHDSGQFHGFGDSAAIFLAVELNGENHSESIPQFAPRVLWLVWRESRNVTVAQASVPASFRPGVSKSGGTRRRSISRWT